MPIDYSEYSPDWHEISRRIRFQRAGGRCEWTEEDGSRCEAINYEPHPITGSKVILTVAHLDHDKSHNADDNLLALCQLHHLGYDRDRHVANRKKNRRRAQVAAGQLELEMEIADDA